MITLWSLGNSNLTEWTPVLGIFNESGINIHVQSFVTAKLIKTSVLMQCY